MTVQNKVRERGILFTGYNVNRIMEKKKWQTRRVFKLPKNKVLVYHLDQAWADPGLGDGGYLKVPYHHKDDECGGKEGDCVERVRCPYGIVEDRLYVREAWAAGCEYDEWLPRNIPEGQRIWYRADASQIGTFGRWRPSLHMVRWMSRIDREIVKVRVERLQDITEEDARAEGAEPGIQPGTKIIETLTAKSAFAYGWNKINAKRGFGWEANPFVWIINFRRIERS